MSLLDDLIWYWDLTSADATITDQHSGLVLSRIGTTTTDATGGPDGGPCISVGNAAGKYRNASVAKTVSYDDGFTANIWCRSTGSSSILNVVMMHRANPPGGIPGGLYWQIDARSQAVFANSDEAVAFDNSMAFRVASTAQQALNAWQMLTIIDDGTVTTLYRDAVSVATSSSALGTRSTAAAPFCIGGDWTGTANTTGNHRGQIAKAGVWNTPLSQADITRLYNGGAGRNYADLGSGSSAAAVHFFQFGF